ncbi:hypothetical protein MOXK23_20780 [Moraxella sp. K23]
MKYKPYDEYKKSGVNLLEQIPKNWQKYSFKELFTKKEITNLTNEGLLSVYLDRGVIPYSEGGGLVHKPSESLEKYQLVDINDFVMNNQQAWRGSVGISNYRGIVSPAYLVFSTDKEKADPSYLKYLLKDNISVSQFSLSSLSVGTIQRQVKWHLLRNISLFLPSLDDQLKISKFLDKEILKIDNLISKQEQLIKLLDEQRKSIISHAVTKGLNPNAPMKDSGVEWLGEVPEHWEVVPSKFYFTERGEKAESNDRQLTASQKHGIMYQDEYMAEKGRLMVVMKNPEILKKVKPNDFVISMRSFQGGLELSYNEGSISSAYVMLKPNLEFIYPEFYKYFFKTPRYIKALQSTSNLVRDGQALRFNNFSQVKIVIPPLDEQKQIYNYLEGETLRIQNLISKQNILIEKLKEYRSSIISYAVTGKIDVREAL